MQTEVSTLPVVCSDGSKRSVRNSDINRQSSPAEVKNHNTCKNSSFFVSNRKQLHPLVGGPYRNSMRMYALSEPLRSTNKTTVGQRVMSAKMLRVKQLQNQLTDAHYHLNELANENRLLKALQKRQDSALKKYEGTHAELPRIINSHHEELKVLQLRHKKLRTQHKHTCDLLKEKENEIHSLQSQNKHLMQLSKDRHLEERDKLQIRVSDLNFRIEQQQETIQTLNRKLALESKSLKHQLNTEVAKHKETQRNLNEALEKLKNLEDLLDNREKRLYYTGRLPVCTKGKPAGNQSLTNLGQNSGSSNTFKPGSKCRGYQNEVESGSLPKLTKTESNEGKTIPNLKLDQNDSTPITETMSSLQQVRKFRLQKSYSRNGSAGLSRETEKCDDDESTARNESNSAPKSSSFEKLRSKRTTLNEVESDEDELKKFVDDFAMTNGKGPYKLPKQLMKEFGYSSDESETDTKDNGELEYESKSLASKSRDLHTRLISDGVIVNDAVNTKSTGSIHSSSTSESESESRNKTKSVSTIMKDYLTLRGRSPNGDENSSLSLDDFLKLDINATDSELGMERLRKIKGEQMEKVKVLPDGSPTEGYETSQQRLLTITKSWTELQAKIKREREISDSELKTLNEGTSFASHVLHEKLSCEDLEKNSSTSSRTKEKYDRSYEMSGRLQRRMSDLVSDDTNSETPHAQQNGRIADSPVSVDDSKSKTEIGHRASTYVKESEKLLTHIEDSTNITNHKIEENLTTNTYHDLAKEEYSSENVEQRDEDVKLVNYNKEKLLAAMKAIDDNENIEFVTNRKHQGVNGPIRSQSTITENLYRGLPSHARKKDDILKDIFGDVKSETKLRATCSKLH